MKSTSETIIDLPVDQIDLPAWLATLSDRDYQACAKGHVAAGAYREDRILGSINVENVGGHLLVQHYLAEDSSPHRITMRSRNTRAYVLHTLPATIEVVWWLEVEPRDSTSSLFRCTVEANIAPLLNLAATLVLLPLFLRRHVREETPLFAADITRKRRAADKAAGVAT
jgi:hypothetical protein